MGDLPGRLVVQELQRTWKFHPKCLAGNRSTKPAINKKVTKASDLKIGQLVLIKNHQKGQFNLTYIYDHWVAGIPNESTVLLTIPDSRERKCNIHHVKPVSTLDMTTSCQSSNVECPKVHSNNSGTAFSRTQVVQDPPTLVQPTIKNKETMSILLHNIREKG